MSNTATFNNLPAEQRKASMLQAGLKLAVSKGLYVLTITDVAIEISKTVNCSRSLVAHYFGSTLKFRTALIEHARAEQNNTVTAQAILMCDQAVSNLSPQQRQNILLAGDPHAITSTA